MSAPRIAYLLKKFPRLSETFILQELLALEEAGVPLRILSRRAPDDEPRHPELARLRAEVEVLPSREELDPWQELFLRAPDPDSLFAQLPALVADSRDWGHPRITRLVGEALWVRRRCAELGVEHLHVHFATDSAVVALLARRIGGPTYSVTAHAKDIYRNTVDRDMLRRIVAESQFTVTVCDANVQAIEERIGDEACTRVKRSYNGIDLSAFEGEVVSRSETRVLGVGRLVEKKGFDVLIDAVAQLRSRGVEVEVDIVGDGDERGDLAQRVERHGLGDRVRLLGPLDQSRVRELLATSALFCLPCRIGDDGNRDALPTVLLESLAAGLPSISTPVTGVPEILDDGRAGVLVPENDADAVAAAIESLMGDPARRAELAEAGRRRAQELFDRRDSGARLQTWLGQALDREGAACASPA